MRKKSSQCALRGSVTASDVAVLCEGWLEKLSSGKMVTRWQPRYFRIGGHYLRYSTDDQTDEVLAACDLNEVSTFVCEGLDLRLTTAEGTELRLRAPTAADVERWRSSLQSVMDTNAGQAPTAATHVPEYPGAGSGNAEIRALKQELGDLKQELGQQTQANRLLVLQHEEETARLRQRIAELGLDEPMPISKPKQQVGAIAQPELKSPPGVSALLQQGEEEQPDSSAADLWTVKSYLRSVDITDDLAKAILCKKPSVTSEQQFFFGMEDADLKGAIGAGCLEDVVRTILKSRVAAASETTAEELNDKFMQDGSNFQFVYDDVAALHAGLEAKIGNPSPNVFTQMEWEHTMGPLAHVQFNYGTDNAFTTTAQKEWEIAVHGSEHAFAHREEWLSKERFAEERNQSVSEWLGGRQLVRPLARVISENPGMMKGAGEDPEEGVVDVEALGGVLYSGPMFLWYNSILRFVGDTSDGYRPDNVTAHKLEG
jgi:hypothetical protein